MLLIMDQQKIYQILKGRSDFMMKISILTIMICILSGCTTIQPTIQVTKQWEGHYKSEKEFYNSTKDIKLEKNESIWVLSNRTLIRVLNNNEIKKD